MLIAYAAVIGCDTAAVIRVVAVLHLVDQITNDARMKLRLAKHNCFLFLVCLFEVNLRPVRFTLNDLDDLVENLPLCIVCCFQLRPE